MPLSDWLTVHSVCTVDRQPETWGTHSEAHWGNGATVCPTGVVSTEQTEGTSNQSDRGPLGHTEGTGSQPRWTGGGEARYRQQDR